MRGRWPSSSIGCGSMDALEGTEIAHIGLGKAFRAPFGNPYAVIPRGERHGVLRRPVSTSPPSHSARRARLWTIGRMAAVSPQSCQGANALPVPRRSALTACGRTSCAGWWGTAHRRSRAAQSIVPSFPPSIGPRRCAGTPPRRRPGQDAIESTTRCRVGRCSACLSPPMTRRQKTRRGSRFKPPPCWRPFANPILPRRASSGRCGTGGAGCCATVRWCWTGSTGRWRCWATRLTPCCNIWPRAPAWRWRMRSAWGNWCRPTPAGSRRGCAPMPRSGRCVLPGCSCSPVRSASISTTPSARMLRCAIVIMAAQSQGDWHESLSWLYGGGDLQGAANTPISL